MSSTTPLKRPSPAKMRPAPTQGKALVHLRAFFALKKRSPTTAELASLLESSESMAKQTIARLQRRGFISRTGTRYLNLQLTRKGSDTALAIERGEQDGSLA